MTTDEIKQKVVDYAYGYGIDPNIALVQINRESGFVPTRVGADGERGLAQIMPGTWDRFGSGSFDNAFDVEANLTAWGNYMSYLSGLFGGDIARILIGYNGGEGHLTNPDKYGPPSNAAYAYASEILAQSGVQQQSNTGDLGTIVVTPGGYEQIPNWLKWAGLGFLGLILWSALRD